MAVTATQAPADEQAGNPSIVVQRQITRFLEKGTLVLPKDYSAENALKQAWLALQEVEDKDKRKVIVNGQVNTAVVTYASVVNALTDMVVQALSVAKKQCYLIVYGNQLTCQRSYFGDEMLAMRVSEIPLDPYSQVIYEGDTFEFSFMKGKKMVTNHVSSLANQNNKIVGAYHGFLNEQTGEDLGAVIMTFEEIEKSWSKSKTYRAPGAGGPGSNTPHNQFTGEMCIRTVTRKRCKPVINSSTDAMLLQAIRRQDIEEAEAEMAAIVDEKANKGMITMPPMVAPVLEAGQAPVDLSGTHEREMEPARAPVSPAAPAAQSAPVTEETQEEESPAAQETVEAPAEEPKAAIPVKKRETAAAEPAVETPPVEPPKLMLSQQQHMDLSDRLSALPGAPSPTEFVAECRQIGITTWAQVEAKIEALESDAAGY